MDASYRAGIFLLCLSFSSLPVFAQQPASSPLTTGQLQSAPASASTNRIVLDVVVTDKAGKAVQGLTEKDFTVLDNGHPQSILSFQATGGGTPTANIQSADQTVKIILLVDEVNTNFNRVSYEREQIQKFLQQNNGVLAHPTSMAFFSDTGTEIQDATSSDGKSLLAAFDQHETALRTVRRSQGFYGAVERFQLSLNALNSLLVKEAQTPGRKLVVWISPGWPILSGPGIELSTNEEAKFFTSVVALSRALREARMTLYSISPLGAEDSSLLQTSYYREFLKPVTAAKKVLPGNLALQVLATQSGGLVFSPSNDIEGQIDRSVVDANVFYTLTIDAAKPDRPNEYHALDVKIAPPGLTARTRSGYYVQP